MNTEETLTDLYELRNTGNDIARKYTLYRRIEESVKEKDKEIERLNNIINELEKWLKTRNGIKYYPEAFDKLQELKGSDKE